MPPCKPERRPTGHKRSYMGFSIDSVPDYLKVRLIVPAFRDANGKPIEVVHVFRMVFGSEMETLIDRVVSAGTGLEGKAREQAEARAAFEVWAEVIDHVENYDGAEGLTGKEVKDFFLCKHLTPGPKTEAFQGVLGSQARIAFNAFYAQLRPSVIFHGEDEGSSASAAVL